MRGPILAACIIVLCRRESQYWENCVKSCLFFATFDENVERWSQTTEVDDGIEVNENDGLRSYYDTNTKSDLKFPQDRTSPYPLLVTCHALHSSLITRHSSLFNHKLLPITPAKHVREVHLLGVGGQHVLCAIQPRAD